ncbi:MAG: hypothetical protein H7A25_10975 [Leptospiraceae bacterium]|nr:hypothetical protein [Leptospiraceae bacterium]
MATYVLAGNTEFIIDTEDLDKVCKYKWRGESTGFIVSGKGKTYTRLNKLLGDPKATFIHYINKNRRDNRKNNLKPLYPKKKNTLMAVPLTTLTIDHKPICYTELGGVKYYRLLEIEKFSNKTNVVYKTRLPEEDFMLLDSLIYNSQYIIFLSFFYSRTVR